jgi:hypothetical protein
MGCGRMRFLLSLWYKFKEWQYERKCIKHLGMKPTKIYLSQKDFEALQKRLEEPVNEEAIKRFKEILNRPSPWNEQ